MNVIKKFKIKKTLGLYFDALKQTRVFGFIYAAIMLLLAVYTTFTYGDNHYLFTLRPNDYSIVFFIPFWIVVPSLLLYLFRHMLSRKAVDFYDSQPISRKKLFWSYYGVTFTWTLSGTLIYWLITLLSSFASQISNDVYGVFIFEYWICALLVSLVGCFQVSGICLLAISYGNNWFSRASLIAILSFIPRGLVQYLWWLITNNKAIFYTSQPDFNILKAQMNILFSSIVQRDISVFDWKSIVYSLILGLVFITLARIKFSKWKSEMVEVSNPNDILKVVICGVFGFVIWLPSLLFTYQKDFIKYSFIKTPLVFYVLSILFMYIYHIVLARNGKDKKSTITWDSILVAAPLCILFSIACFYGNKAVINMVDSTDEIEYIEIGIRYKESNGRFLTYNTSIDMSILDSEIAKNIVVTSLHDNVKYIDSINKYFFKSKQFDTPLEEKYPVAINAKIF